MSSLECFRARLIDSRIENADQARFKKNKKNWFFPAFRTSIFVYFKLNTHTKIVLRKIRMLRRVSAYIATGPSLKTRRIWTPLVVGQNDRR